MAPGRPERREFEYLRHGTRCLIASLLVPTGQLLGDVSARRGSRDFGRHLRHTAERFPDAVRFHWVLDNLNTHWNLSLCRLIARLSGVPFEPKKLRTGAQRRAFLTDPEHKHVLHYTPKHGSWLDMAESELSILSLQCLDRRIPDRQTLIEEVATWQNDRNKNHTKADWHFATANARIKLKRLYPAV